MNAPTLEHMTDTVHDVAHKVADRAPDIAHKVADRAPDIASHVGRSARSTAETVSDAVVKLAQKTPFLDAPKPQHHRGRFMFRAALIATIAGLALWFANRRRSSRPWYEADDSQATESTRPTAERRFATAGS